MTACSQLCALFKKNFILMKRNICSSICQILFPIFLFICISLIRRALKIEDITLIGDDNVFFRNNTYIYPTSDRDGRLVNNSNPELKAQYQGFNILNPFSICKNSTRRTIGVVGHNDMNNQVIQNLNSLTIFPLNYTYFDSLANMSTYIASDTYSKTDPQLCFGFGIFKEDNSSYDYSLSYFASNPSIDNLTSDIPATQVDSLSPFSVVPDTDSYGKYKQSGILFMMNLINNAILTDKYNSNGSGNIQPKIAAGITAMKYPVYSADQIERVLGFLVPFILVVIYMIPLIVFTYRMVKDKETRVKEGMKIMGMKDGSFFWSYFFQFLILNTIVAIFGTFILNSALGNISPGIRFVFLFLYGTSVYALSYLIQSIVDKATISIILSIMVYYIFFFVSPAVSNDTSSNTSKMFASLLSPTALQLGFLSMAQFELSKMGLKGANINYRYNEYSVADMLIMFIIDILLYFLIGFYLENVLPHQYGTSKKPWFLFTSSYWCPKSMKLVNQKLSEKKNSSTNNQSQNFQDESDYLSKYPEDSYMRLIDVQKVFDDGKKALNGVTFNLYKDEIFALLGHNGAGKSTLINILSGLYESSGGQVMYQGVNILENLDAFRRKIGICPQHDVLFEDLTVKEHLELFANFKGVNPDNLESDIHNLLKEMELLDKMDDLSQNLSGGQKRKLSIAIALVGGSEIIFFDEPSSGMDITNRRKMWDILKKFTKNRIIILTTHYMEEASVLGNRIGILSGGQLKCIGSPIFLINRYGKNISLTLVKKSLKNLGLDENEVNNNIVDFVIKSYNTHSGKKLNLHEDNMEVEILSEEILIRLPKNESESSNNLDYKAFFQTLDDNLTTLQLRAYSAAMPTLEDVFLLVSDEIKKGIIESNKRNDVEDKAVSHREVSNLNLKKFDDYDPCAYPAPAGLDKILNNFKWCLIKRYYQTIRNFRVFSMEVLAPIILVLIGLGLSSVQFVKDQPSKVMSLDQYTVPQVSLITDYSYNNGKLYPISKLLTPSSTLHTFEFDSSINTDTSSNLTSGLINFNNVILNKYNATQVSNPVFNNTDINKYMGSYYFIQFDEANLNYEFISVVNLKSRNSGPIMTQEMYNSLIKHITKDNKLVIRVNIIYLF